MKFIAFKILAIVITFAVFLAPMAFAESLAGRCQSIASANQSGSSDSAQPCCPCCKPKKTQECTSCGEFEGLCVSQNNESAIGSSEFRINEDSHHDAFAVPSHDFLLSLHVVAKIGTSPPLRDIYLTTAVSLC
jgi:hypothetical protein